MKKLQNIILSIKTPYAPPLILDEKFFYTLKFVKSCDKRGHPDSNLASTRLD